MDFILVSVDKEASCFPFPLIVNFSHWYNSHLVSLSQDLLLRKLTGVTGHQLSRGHLDSFFFKCSNWNNFGEFLLKGNLSGDIPDQVLRDVQFGGDVLRGDESPGDRELDVGPDVGRPLACRAVHLAPRLSNM